MNDPYAPFRHRDYRHFIAMVLIASLIGAVVGIAMKLRSSLREGRYVPFGPFLAGAGLLMFVVGPATLVQWVPFIFPFSHVAG